MSKSTKQRTGKALLQTVAKNTLVIAVTIASVLFLAAAFRDSWHRLPSLIVDEHVVTATLLLSIIYGVTFFIQAGAWAYALRHNSPVRVSFGDAAHVYCLCNIGKYLPGSVFHFAGRQILGARLGWSHSAIARATFLEVVGTVVSICLSAVVIGLTPPGHAALDAAFQRWGLTASYWQYIASLAIAVGLIVLFTFSRLGLFKRLFGLSTQAALTAVGFNIVYFSTYAAMAVIFARQLATDLSTPDQALVAMAFLSAWLAGFVVPAAPGGIGVRECVLVLLLAGIGNDGKTVGLVLGLGMRCVNTLGDIVCLAFAYLLKHLTDQRQFNARSERG